ncbi:hypothetical protein Afil01_63960 [Actinorhabdospora filicis]|uniref:Uncharacterized protein n=1 Tax=Actinorhabdospora filicis TaxID=1785913 RepID=A0A9W6WCF4_9ACTN|nr:hypothetical protein [Actinorhabdospora filicis]GLZ81589.1 hypothetical protein Afil01_63960 [Actinorhabdospora filicis]
MRRIGPLRTAGFGLLLLPLVAAGCGSSVPPQLAAPRGYVHQVSGVGGSGCDKAEDQVQTGAGDLIGPHFALTVACVSTMRSVRGLDAVYPDKTDAPPLAPPGYEFVVVTISPTAPGETAYSSGGSVNAELVLGDFHVPLERTPDPGDVIVAVAPVKEPATLAVTDEGRLQSFSLRDRERQESVNGYYSAIEGAVDVPDYHAYFKGESGSSWGWYECNGGITAWRDLWDPELGWVSGNSARLTIKIYWPKQTKDVVTYFELYAENSLKMSTSGQYFNANDVTWTDTDDKGGYFTWVYEMPGDATTFELEFQPRGKLTLLSNKATLALTQDVEVTRYTLDFTRR